MSRFSESTFTIPPGSRMLKLIRSKRTKAFLKPDGTWTLDIRQAMHLALPLLPRAFRQLVNVDEAEMYFSFGNGRQTPWDFALPLQLERQPLQPAQLPLTDRSRLRRHQIP